MTVKLPQPCPEVNPFAQDCALFAHFLRHFGQVRYSTDMTETATEPLVEVSLNDIVTSEIRAQLGRRKMPDSRLATSIGMARGTLSKRLSSHAPWRLNELERVAWAFDMNPMQLFKLVELNVFNRQVDDLVTKGTKK